ncbi:MAG: hypothetical protein ABFS56_31940, partial [Pseudomonadota bacterium]
EFLREDPTAQYLFRQMYPDEIAAAEARGVKEGVKEATSDFTRRLDSKIADARNEGAKEATSDFIRRLDGLLSKEQMKQVFGENALASQK